MGLDMYLHKRTYVKKWKFQKESAQYNIEITKNGLPAHIKNDRLCFVTEEVGYWRKFNALHQWFVNNVQDGDDDCKEYYVAISQLSELLKLLKQISNGDIDKADEMLPTQSGFFFGNTEYDEWYFNNVYETIELLEKLLQEDNSGSSFFYCSSW
jgi:hypothetical protein